MQMQHIYSRTFVMLSFSISMLSSCDYSQSDNFNYNKNRDKFAGITISTSESNFPLSSGDGANIYVGIKCIRNDSDHAKNELSLEINSGTTSKYDNSVYLNAFIYKFDQSNAVVYQKPNPMNDPSKKYPDNEYGKYLKIYGEAYATDYIPPSILKNVKINAFDIFERGQIKPKVVTLRFVYGAAASDTPFGGQNVQYYSQYRSQDVGITMPGSNFGRVLSDCGIH